MKRAMIISGAALATAGIAYALDLFLADIETQRIKSPKHWRHTNHKSYIV